ncbi:MAG: putative metalloprotease CJM1_0395 family protein [Candidatus Eremiobacterota bacterium]
MEGMRPIFGGTVPDQPPAPGTARDMEAAAGACGGGCGCITCSGLGEDPLVILGRRDDEVRTHENDHLTEAGEFALGGPVFQTYTASNGRTYALGGHVSVDVSEVAGDPQATVDKMRKLQRAALKPANPSGQDRTVAAECAAKEAAALRQLTEKAMRDGRTPIPLFH